MDPRNDTDSAVHRTRAWMSLNAPNPGNAHAEQQALRALIERNTVKKCKRNRLAFYILPSIVLVATALIAIKSIPTQRQLLAVNPSCEAPGNGTQLSTRAESLVEMGRYEEALMDFACILRINKDSARAREGIALCYAELGRNTEAIDRLNEIIEKNPNSISAHMMRGECYRNMHEFDKARSDFSWLLQNDKKCSTAYCSMADLLTMEGKNEEALIYLNSAILTMPNKFETRQRRADILVSLGQYQEANKEFDIISQLPDKQENFSTLKSRCKVLLAIGSYDKALPILDKLISLRPEQVTPYVERAQVYIASKKFSKAMKDCNTALAKSSTNCAALTLRAQCHAALGDEISAMHDFKEAAERNPDSTDAFLKLASYQINQSQFASALETYKNVLAINANSKEAIAGKQFAQAKLTRMAGKTKIDSFQIAQEPQWKELDALGFADVLAKGYTALREGNCELACYALKRAIMLQPNSPEARRYLAYALIETGKTDAAQEQLKALAVLGHEEASDNVRLAAAFHKSGQHQKTIEILQKHLRQHKADVDAIVMLSDALMATNAREQALKLCSQAMSIVVSRRDQARLRDKYTALKNVEVFEPQNGNAQAPVDTSPIESRGS